MWVDVDSRLGVVERDRCQKQHDQREEDVAKDEASERKTVSLFAGPLDLTGGLCDQLRSQVARRRSPSTSAATVIEFVRGLSPAIAMSFVGPTVAVNSGSQSFLAGFSDALRTFCRYQ